MRTSGLLAALFLSLGLAGEAKAQFANRSIGLTVGYLGINADPTVRWGLPFQLEGSLYIENGFDLTVRIPLMVLTEEISRRQIVGAGTNLGVRYLFSEESLRPYAGLELVFLHIFRDENGSNFVGVAPSAGLDYFVADTVSIGVRGMFNVYVWLNQPTRTAVGAQLGAAAYF